MTTLAIPFSVTLGAIIVALLWLVLGALCFFLWRRAKSSGHLLMMIGAGFLGLDFLFIAFGSYLLPGIWSWTFGVGLLVFGFWLTVKPLVAADVGMVLGKIGLNPPKAPPAPPAAPPPPS